MITRHATHLSGDVAEAQAIGHFLSQGYIVSKPFGSAPYDLIVDDGVTTSRIEVKSTTVETAGWGWRVVVDTDKGFDQLLVVTPNSWFLIPHGALGAGRHSMCVPMEEGQSKWEQYRIEVS